MVNFWLYTWPADGYTHFYITQLTHYISTQGYILKVMTKFDLLYVCYVLQPQRKSCSCFYEYGTYVLKSSL